MTFTTSDFVLLAIVGIMFAVNYLLACRRDRIAAEQIETAVVGVIDQWAGKQYQQLHELGLKLDDLKHPTVPERSPSVSIHEELIRRPTGRMSPVTKPGLFHEESGVVPMKKASE